MHRNLALHAPPKCSYYPRLTCQFMQLMKMTFNVTPLHDVVLPPLSSKVLKYLVLSQQVLPFLEELVRSKDKQKPLFISNLALDGKRLYSRGEPITVKAKTRLTGSVTFPFSKEAFNVGGGRVKTVYGEYEISLKEVSVLDETPSTSTRGNLRVSFLTPALLSSKIYLPPFLREKYRRKKIGFSLIPTPGLVVAYGYRQYLALLGKTDSYENDIKTFKLLVMANALSRVVGYRLYPETVVIGEDEKGRLRLTRGVKGWIEFDIVGKLKESAAKYLEVASFLGIGRSRGIGLGEVHFKMVERGENSH
ncbi:CRISPR system precrRNA processing endoribonuclease RAMP protein Cas6 [Metallosphaera sedula]|uniref:CRISPR system precrRNA processing endoribonuclease RAMP protein Cas6 n=2 Tax=Sulfolobaceae TaxID=118883 RepID=A0A4D8RQK9_METPR|nr:CRISPR system precrRNA processing endoribonuclease RAMP protein Cas6 [Metallosphaera prunae]